MARLQALRLPNRNRCCRKQEVSCGCRLQQETPDQLVGEKEKFGRRKKRECLANMDRLGQGWAEKIHL